jgi:hypothetical protein
VIPLPDRLLIDPDGVFAERAVGLPMPGGVGGSTLPDGDLLPQCRHRCRLFSEFPGIEEFVPIDRGRSTATLYYVFLTNSIRRLIVILFLSRRPVIFMALLAAERAKCHSTIRIRCPLAMPHFCGMRAVAFPPGATGCRAVIETVIVYASSAHYRWYPAALVFIHLTEWNDGLLGFMLP